LNTFTKFFVFLIFAFISSISSQAACLKKDKSINPDVIKLIEGSKKKYKDWGAKKKQDFIWKLVAMSKFPSGKMPYGGNALDLLKTILYCQASPSFVDSTDFKVVPGKKILHPHGTVAKVELVIDNPKNQSGILKTGAIGIARFSEGVPINPKEKKVNFIIGTAIKFLIDGVQSLNIHVMNSLDGQGNNLNFFSLPMSTASPSPKGLALRFIGYFFIKNIGKMRKRHPYMANVGTGDAFTRPVRHLSTWDRNGRFIETLEERKFHHSFTLRPGKGTVKFDPNDRKDLRIKFSSLKPGATLWEVWVRKGKREKNVKIGRLILRSETISSQFGDRILNFQHSF
jgi:hypothetical protein